MSRLLLIHRRQVLCVAGIALIFLLGTHSAANAFMYSIDGASPSVPGVSAADILTMGGPPGGPPVVAFSAGVLGLAPGDDIDALSVGPAFLDEVLFSVDRTSTGVGGTDVSTQFGLGQAAGDSFITPLAFPGTNFLDFNQDSLGLAPGVGPGVPATPPIDNLDAWDDDFPGSVDFTGGPFGGPDGIPDVPIFFSLAAGSPTLGTLSFSPADILVTSGGIVSVAVPEPGLGLTAGDDIDALVWDGFSTLLFSLAPGSTSLGISGDSAADVFLGSFTPGFPFIPAVSLGLLAGDNLNALDVFEEEPIPEPSTIALLGIGLAGLGGSYLRRRRISTKKQNPNDK